VKRKAKQSGSGGRLRLGLLLATAAALLLVPVAAASASEVKVTIAGHGSGTVVDFGGSSTINCHSPAPGEGTCTSTLTEEGGAWKEEAAPGSKFTGWTLVKGINYECSAMLVTCVAGPVGGVIELKATFQEEVHIEIEGAGSGEVVDKSLNANEKGTPPVNCHWNGAAESGDCDVLAGIIFGFPGILVEEHAAGDSEFVEWKLEEGEPLECQQFASTCSALGVNASYEPEGGIIIKAVFAPKPKQPLTLTTSGEGSGTFECEDVTAATPAAPCVSGDEFLENDVVKVIPVNGTGSVFAEFNSDNGGESSTGEVTMTGPRSVNAKFDKAPEELSVTEGGGGTGSVTCKVNNVSAPCNGTYEYGDTIDVAVEPDEENKVESITGPGCSISGEGLHGEGASCSFTLTSNTTVAVVFESAGTKATLEGNLVHGEVKPETTLETGGCDDVDLSIFAPGIEATYPGTCAVTSTTTGAVTELTAEDEEESGEAHEGYLRNDNTGGPYWLEDPLKVKADGSLEALTSQVLLHTYAAPVYKDIQGVEFSQDINAGEALRTGTYAKTILLTLEQTTL
jgi:hypothetical protein